MKPRSGRLCAANIDNEVVTAVTEVAEGHILCPSVRLYLIYYRQLTHLYCHVAIVGILCNLLHIYCARVSRVR